MRFKPCGASFCLLVTQAAAQAPLTFAEIQAVARPAPEQWRLATLLAERRLQSRQAGGFLREGPTLAFQAGPRRTSGAPATTDRGLEVDLPLFLSAKVRTGLEQALGSAHPLLLEAARRESGLRLRAAFLEAWLAAQLVTLREVDLAIVERWLAVVQLRFEAGAIPAYQVALVAGERLQVVQDQDEAKVQAARCWGALVALADIPATPVPLAEPGPPPVLQYKDLLGALQKSPLRKALQAQLELEERSLRLQEALSQSRLSLRGSFAQEGEERVSRVGLAVRLPRPGESAAVRSHFKALVRAAQGEIRQALAEFDARVQAALVRLPILAPGPPPPDFSQAIQAVDLRLQEGRDRPSDALPLRRQFLEAQMASLRRSHAQQRLSAELQTLLPEEAP
jgi:hypothetical protein